MARVTASEALLSVEVGAMQASSKSRASISHSYRIWFLCVSVTLLLALASCDHDAASILHVLSLPVSVAAHMMLGNW